MAEIAAINESSATLLAESRVAKAIPQGCLARGELKAVLIQPVLALMSEGIGAEEAAKRTLARAARGDLPKSWMVAATRKGYPTAVSLKRWALQYKRGGFAKLVDQNKGQKAATQPWHARARYFFELPTHPGNGDIASRLRQEGYCRDLNFRTFTQQIARLRERTPSNQADASPEKLGWHYHWQNKTKYARRDWKGVPVGYRYEVDGHTCDFYIEHPSNGGYFQPELTVWMDVRSRFVVGFWIGMDENAAELRYSLSSVIGQHDHVPCEIHLDHGAGRAETFTDAVSGYCAKLGIDPEFAGARNARSKIIEGEFHRFKDRFSRFMPTFLHDRTDDFFRGFADKWAKNLVPRITLWQLMDALRQYFDYRNAEVMKVQGESIVPAELFATLERNSALVASDAISRPREVRTVQRCTVDIIKRSFHSTQLNVVEGKKVLVEYDEHLSNVVWVYTLQGVFIAVAEVIRERPGIAPNVVAERLAKRQAGQMKRLEIRAADLIGKNVAPISSAAVIDTIEGFDGGAPAVSSPISEILAQGHSFTLPKPPVAPQHPVRAVASSTLRQLREEQAEAEVERETPAQRYARAKALLRREERQQLGPEDAKWLAIYSTSSEYHARRLLDEESGIDETNGEAQ